MSRASSTTAEVDPTDRWTENRPTAREPDSPPVALRPVGPSIVVDGGLWV